MFQGDVWCEGAALFGEHAQMAGKQAVAVCIAALVIGQFFGVVVVGQRHLGGVLSGHPVTSPVGLLVDVLDQCGEGVKLVDEKGVRHGVIRGARGFVAAPVTLCVAHESSRVRAGFDCVARQPQHLGAQPLAACGAVRAFDAVPVVQHVVIEVGRIARQDDHAVDLPQLF